ncbi:MAG: NAD-dependent epimerase/dehydratase family protein [Pseudomonadota bacterium]|nr:NAD-dependent epimerase/dehydratase family protein [Pseudomonadota bacterium]
MKQEIGASPLVSVSIVNFNGGELVLDAIDAVLQSSVPVEVFVVDNASSDGSRERIEAEYGARAQVTLIANRENLGFAKANNQALRIARGAFLLLLNPDCLVKPRTLEGMLREMEARPDAGMAGCLVRNPDGTEQSGCRREIPRPWPSLVQLLRLHRLFPDRSRATTIDLSRFPLPATAQEVAAISGSFMFVRREAMDDVGLMDEGYFLHCEDLDWCASFSERGWKILFVPSVDVVHYKGSCSKDEPVRVLWYKHRGMVRFYQKFLQRDYALPLTWLVRLGIWSRFVLLAIHTKLRGLVKSLGPWRRRSSQSAHRAAPVAPLGPRHSATGVETDEARVLRGVPVLVTGGTGFIGFHLVETLLDGGAGVRILSRSREKVARLWPSGSVDVRIQDLTEPAGLEDVCRGVDTLFHLASYAHDADATEAEQRRQHKSVTEEGTKAILDAAVAAGVRRFVFASSVKAMGEGGHGMVSEDTPAVPESAYGRSKWEAERAVLDAQRFGLEVCVLRFPMVYGPGNKGNLPRLIAAIDRGLFPPLPPGVNRRSMVHVHDVVQALLLAATHPAAAGNSYIVTDGRFYSTRRIYEIVNEALGRETPRWSIPVGLLESGARVGDWLGSLVRHPMPLNSASLHKLLGSAEYSSTRIQHELGYCPRYTLEEAIPSLIAEYRMGEAV